MISSAYLTGIVGSLGLVLITLTRRWRVLRQDALLLVGCLLLVASTSPLGVYLAVEGVDENTIALGWVAVAGALIGGSLLSWGVVRTAGKPRDR